MKTPKKRPRFARFEHVVLGPRGGLPAKSRPGSPHTPPLSAAGRAPRGPRRCSKQPRSFERRSARSPRTHAGAWRGSWRAARRRFAQPPIPEVRLLVLQQRGGAVGRPQLPRHSQERRLLTILARHGAEGLAGRPAPTSFTRLAARAKPTVGPRLPFESRACARAHAHENTSNAEGGRRADRRAGRFWRPRAPSSAGLKSSWVRLIYTALL